MTTENSVVEQKESNMQPETPYIVHTTAQGNIVKTWTKGVPVEDAAIEQLKNVADLPFIYKWVAGMPDIHFGMGCCIGAVIPTRGAIIPASVGVDIGCGMRFRQI